MIIKQIEENITKRDGTRRIVGMFDTTLFNNEKIMPHFHEDVEEIYYILEGEGLMVLDNEHEFVKEGEIIYIPPKKTHSITATSNELRFMTISVDVSATPSRRRRAVDELGYFL